MNLRVSVPGEVKGDDARSRSESESEEGVQSGAEDAKPSDLPLPISVEKLLDEVRVGVKGQSNSEIARTPRNAFRCSPASEAGAR